MAIQFLGFSFRRSSPFIHLLMFVSLFWSMPVLCHVTEHLKTAENKQCQNPLRNIDFIYMINLDERPEKFQKSLAKLYPYGILPYRFSAVNGWELSLSVINDIGVKFDPTMPSDMMGTCYLQEAAGQPTHEIMHVTGRNYFAHKMTRGAIGIVLSHLSVLKDALDSGYETIWVMEDDIDIIQSPLILPDMIDSLEKCVGKGNWDIMFTDKDTKNRLGNYVSCLSYAPRPNYEPKDPTRFAQKIEIGEHFHKIGARYGAYSVIISRSGMEKLYAFITTHDVFLPYDMDYTLPDDIKLYSLREDIVSPLVGAETDNERPGYSKKKALYEFTGQ